MKLLHGGGFGDDGKRPSLVGGYCVKCLGRHNGALGFVDGPLTGGEPKALELYVKRTPTAHVLRRLIRALLVAAMCLVTSPSQPRGAKERANRFA